MNDTQATDIVEHVSVFTFATTVERVTAAIERAGLILFCRVDHAAGARDVGLEMPPTTLLIYGHPRGGTPVMLAAPFAAIDLPLRVLIREREDGRTAIAFRPVTSMLRQAGAPPELAARLEPAQHVVLDAARPGPPPLPATA